MKQINVHTKFTLFLPGAVREFLVGQHEVSDAIADHWYVKLHSDPAGDPVDGSFIEDSDAKGDSEAPASKKASGKK